MLKCHYVIASHRRGNPEKTDWIASPVARNDVRGFTLLEILIALFVFSILALMLSTALHNVINIEAGTDKNADRLRQLQFTLVLLSRDVEQTVNRPVLNATGRQDGAFIGKAGSMSFTHAGIADAPDTMNRSDMQRAEYSFHDNGLWRRTWLALDLAPDAKSKNRKLLTNVVEGHFEYLDEKNRFHKEWPIAGQSNSQPLPKAVRVYLTISNWGSMSQLYVIPVQVSKKSTPPSGA